MVMPVLMQFKSSTSLPLCLCPCLGAYALIVTLIDPASFPFVLASGCSGVLSREVESLAWLGPHVLLLLLLLRSLGRLPLPITGIIARNVSRLLAFGAAAAAITNRCRLGSSESFAACPRQSWPRV